MNEKTTKQIEEMMKQTIGVEVDRSVLCGMNSITRANVAQDAPAADACNNAPVIQIYDRTVIAHTAV